MDVDPGSGTTTQAHLHLPVDPRSAAEAREFVRRGAGPLDAPTADTLVLLTSELVTNGVVHAATPLVLGIADLGDRVLVAVGDETVARPVRQPISETRNSGRGMLLVEGLADDWGSCRHQGGKSVWFTLRRRQAAP